MYSRPKLLRKYLHYLFTAANGKGHGIHSPFVFSFITELLNEKKSWPVYAQVEHLRQQLQADKTLIEVEDFGAGSGTTKSNKRSIGSIAQHAAKPKKYGQLFYRMVQAYQPTTIIELRTSLGLSTAYLAAANPSGRVFTLEGASSVAAAAENNFRELGLTNIQVIRGDFAKTLPQLVDKSGPFDFVFVDGNHRKAPTLAYFKQLLPKAGKSSVFIFDDIHWSAEMGEAWEAIKQDPAVLLTIDLFFIGIVFFREAFKHKQHFTIRF